jgi:hypothetical protein
MISSKSLRVGVIYNICAIPKLFTPFIEFRFGGGRGGLWIITMNLSAHEVEIE